MISSSPRYWLALHPDIGKPIGGVKQMHRLAEALSACKREVTIIQGKADFHPEWFQSTVKTISFKEWKQLDNLCTKKDISFTRDISGINYGPGIPKYYLTKWIIQLWLRK